MTPPIAIGPGEHAVQFYTAESELAQTVGRYLSDTVEAGAVAIVIATEAHRRAFGMQLVAAGLDPEDCRADGAVIWVDAAGTMAEFMDDGHVDRADFRRVIGAILTQAQATGRPVHAYGEMVALLWEAGNVVAAIELEEAWNELADEFAFALLCAYRTEAVLGDEHAEALRQVCHLHSSVAGAPPACVSHRAGKEVCVEFPADPLAPRSARHFVADALARWGLSQSVCDDAGLVVSELATNAVVHARSAFSVSVRAKGGRVRVSVSDASPLTPTMCHPTFVDASGRGLHLVAALAARWGVASIAGAKVVWARLEA